jgi:hypothetical protein
LDIKPQIKEILLKQERALNVFNKDKKETNKLQNKISSKIKRASDELLINKISEFRVKKEFEEVVHQKKLIERKFGLDNWLMTLRHPSDIKGITLPNSPKNKLNLFTTRTQTDPDLIRNPLTKSDNFIQSNYVTETIRSLDLKPDRFNLGKELNVNKF